MVSQVLLPPPLRIYAEPVGFWFERYLRSKRGEDLDDTIENGEEEEDDDVVFEDCEDLPNMDPNDWKDQDHYKVLGLGKLRYRATPKQIKAAHKQCVLKHHPDKRRAAGIAVAAEADSDYFSCITKAFEILGDKTKRRAFDSVDPLFNDDIPSVSKSSRQNFFDVYRTVFEENSRWSNKKNVPKLGDEKSSIEEVDEFYTFWYDFDSWREYSYYDQEDKEKAEDAYERRWMEKQNKAERQKRKKEEMARIRQLVDNAYTCDPRIKLFKENEKKKKEEEKERKAAMARKLAAEKEAEEKKIQEQQRLEKEKQEKDRLQQQQAAKKAKEKEKKALKKERLKLENFCKENNYFVSADDEKLKMMEQLSHFFTALTLTEATELVEKINKSESSSQKKDIVTSRLKTFQDRHEEEKKKQLQAASKKKSGDSETGPKSEWIYEDLQLLIKAVNLFPAGTEKRWETVANYIFTHSSSGKQRTGKECLARAKNLKDKDLKVQANQKVFERFQENQKSSASGKKVDDVEISQRYDSQPWSSDEQKLLEQALKTYPNGTEKRWDKIAEAVASRTKKECMMRYKDLVEMVKAKKSVQGNKAKK